MMKSCVEQDDRSILDVTTDKKIEDFLLEAMGLVRWIEISNN